MIDTDKYERMRQLLLDFIADPMDEEDEAAWKRHLNTYDELLAEVKQLREELRILNGMNIALWDTVENYDICLDDFTMIDLFNPPEGYEFCEDEERWVKKND